MKKNIFIPAVFLTVFGLALSCAKEAPAPEEKLLEPQEEVTTNPSVIKAGIPDEITKVALADQGVGNGMSLAWEAGDQIRVIATAGGSGNEPFTIKDGFTATSAEFEGTAVEGTAFTVFYPGSYADVAAINARSYTSQVQNGNGNVAHLEWNAIETGLSNYGTLTFSTKQNGALRFKLKLPDAFTKVYKVALKAPTAIFSTTNAGGATTDELVLTLKDGSNGYITLGSDKVLTAYMMVSWNENVIPAGTDITVEVWGDQEEPWVKTKSVAADFTIAGGKVTNVQLDNTNWGEPLFWGGSGTSSDPYQIKTLRNLKNMYTGEANKGIYYVMIDDIALSSEEAAAYVEINNFYGHLDGDNHTITGLTTPLFGDLRGYISNLDVTANVTFNGTDARIKGSDYGIGILAHYIYNTDNTNTVSNVTTRGSLTINGVSKSHSYLVGGLSGASNGVPITDCNNYASITIDNLTTGSNVIRVGGLIGALQSSNRANCTDCKNYGAVAVHSVSSSGEVSVGGVFGHSGQPVTLDNCDNMSTGTVLADYDCSSVAIAMVAGIVASSGSEPTIRNCDNNATVTNSIVAANAFRTAGIISSYTTTSTTNRLVHNCTNNAAILDNSSYATKKYHYVAGIVGYSDGGAPAADYSSTSLSITDCINNGTVTCSASSSNILAVGGILARSAHYPYLYNCENKQAVSSSAPATSMYMAGVLGWVDKGAHVDGCINRGTVTNTGTVTEYMRVGGVIGNFSCAKDNSSSVLPFGTIENSKNYGAISNESATTVTSSSSANNGAYVGGVFGGSASGTTYVLACENKGNVSNTVTGGATAKSMNLGGIAGYMGNADGKIDDCISSCTISSTGTVTNYRSAQVLGSCGTGGAFTISNTKLAGTVNGTLLDADNYSDYIYGYKDGTVTDIATCSFYTE